MEQITLKANINECIVENWQSNTGEVNARVMNVEMCEGLCSCARQFVTFKLADGTIYESLVVDGKAKIPIIEKPQFIKIGLYAENINGDECEKRYSAHPANVYVNMGAYKNGASETPKPTPGDYAELLEQIADLEKDTIKTITEQVKLLDLETGLYNVKGGKVVWDEGNWLGCGMYDGILYVDCGESSIKMSAIGDIRVLGVSTVSAYVEYYKVDNEWSIFQVDMTPTPVVAEFAGNTLTTAKSVIDYVENVKKEIQGDLEELSTLVGGAK